MLFNVALFSSLLLIPTFLAVPSVLGASLARRREGRQSQPNRHREQTDSAVSNTEYFTNWAGAVMAEGNVRSTGYSATAINLTRDLVLYDRELSTWSREGSPSPPH
jgi:hypothetical protein